jgi:hypothetical protein
VLLPLLRMTQDHRHRLCSSLGKYSLFMQLRPVLIHGLLKNEQTRSAVEAQFVEDARKNSVEGVMCVFQMWVDRGSENRCDGKLEGASQTQPGIGVEQLECMVSRS